MANDKDIKIGIATTADTSGVDKADTAIKKLNGTVSVSTVGDWLAGTNGLAGKAKVAEFAVYDLEQQITRTGNSGAKFEPLVERVRLLPPRLDEAAEAAKRLNGGVKNLGGFVNQAGFQVTDFAVQVQGGTSALTAFSQQFPQLIGSVQQSGLELGKMSGGLAALPIGIGTAVSIGAVAVGVGVTMAVAAYDKMKAAEKSLQDTIAFHAAEKLRFAQRLIDLQNREREDFILSVYKEQAVELERQGKALARINELRAAQGTTAQAQADAAITQAQNTGGNVGAAQANALEVSVANKTADLKAQLQKSEQTAADAKLALEQADSILGEFRSRGDEFSDGFKKASADQEKARITNDEAQKDIELQRQKFEEARKQLVATTAASLSNLAKEVGDKAEQNFTKLGQETAAKFDALAAAPGAMIDVAAQQARQAYADIMADGKITLEEAPKLAAAIRSMTQSTVANSQAAQKGLNDAARELERLTAENNALSARLAKLEHQSSQ